MGTYDVYNVFIIFIFVILGDYTVINEKMRSLGAKRSVIRELFEYGKRRKAEIGEDNVYDFSLGNPSVPAPLMVEETLVRLIENENPISLHGYTSAQGDASVRAAIADYVNKTYGERVSADCFYMTMGAAGALTTALTALVCPGEEVVVLTPYFPEYKVFIERCGGVIRTVPTLSDTFMPDVSAIEAAINERTAAVIINSPNNPTGVVYSEDSIVSLCKMLREKEMELGKTIYLISDEPYRELVYGGASVPFLTKYYDDTAVCYSFSKSLSLPGERIGYILLCPRCKGFTEAYQAICGAGRALGFVCAPSLLQRLVAECLGVTADIEVYGKNRRLLVDSLTEYGYEVVRPDGAFYLFIKAPLGDASEFCERAKKYEVLIVPSDDFGTGGYARLSYCVRTEQIVAALPALKALIESYKV